MFQLMPGHNIRIMAEASLLPTDWSIPVKLRDRLGSTAGRQRMLLEDGHLLLVLHAVPGADEIERRGRFFWRDTNGTWRVAPANQRIATLEDHLTEYAHAIEELEQREDAASQARDYFDLL